MNKLGLKLWSTNTDYYLKAAEKLYKEGYFDYIELYIVPNTVGTLAEWQKLDIPFTLHAPHSTHNVNLADRDNFAYNKQIYQEVALFAEVLHPKFTVVHSGTYGNIEETVRQLKIIRPKNMLVENKPYRAPLGKKELCRGYNIEEIKYVLNNYECGFCLDVGHAICSANSQKLSPYDYVAEFNLLQPNCCHLSDGYVDSPDDRHLHFGAGTYNLKQIFKIIGTDKTISIETAKDSKENLDDFKADVKFLRDNIFRKEANL